MKNTKVIVLFTVLIFLFVVQTAKIQAEEVRFKQEERDLYIGQVTRLKVIGTVKKIIWSSNNEKIASVDEEGKVRGLKQGETKILAKIGKKTLKCNIVVMEKGLNAQLKSLLEGEKFQLRIYSTDEEVIWRSANPEIAKVNQNGVVTALKSGAVRIIGRSEDRIYSCKFMISNENDVVYLTFDDGPSADITPKVLDILKKNKIKATFFVLNYSKKNEALIKRIVDEGHTLAIHGYSHNYREIYKTEKAFMENITRLQRKIKNLTAVECKIIRFPGGSSNTVSRFNPKIMTRLTKRVIKEGYHYFDWNVSSGDAGKVKSKKQVFANVTKTLMKNRNNVVLMHDYKGNNKTLEALQDIINFAKQKGYVFKPITLNTQQVHHGVIN